MVDIWVNHGKPPSEGGHSDCANRNHMPVDAKTCWNLTTRLAYNTVCATAKCTSKCRACPECLRLSLKAKAVVSGTNFCVDHKGAVFVPKRQVEAEPVPQPPAPPPKPSPAPPRLDPPLPDDDGGERFKLEKRSNPVFLAHVVAAVAELRAEKVVATLATVAPKLAKRLKVRDETAVTYLGSKISIRERRKAGILDGRSLRRKSN